MKARAAHAQSIRLNRFLGISLLLVAATVSSARAQIAASPSFEVASVRHVTIGNGITSISPTGSSRFIATNASLELLLQIAFGVDDRQILGKPGWLGSEFYTIEAKPEGDVSLSYEQLKPLLQQLLIERFHLAVHHETKEFSGYALEIAKGGAKLEPAKESVSGPNYINSGSILMTGTTLRTFASMLGSPLQQPTVDRTGLTGNYTIHLSFAPEGDPNSTLPSIFTAVQEQLGLKLERQKIPVELLVIDHIDKEPVAN
jgi:uncharacterized protein (TIGR03435 family)